MGMAQGRRMSNNAASSNSSSQNKSDDDEDPCIDIDDQRFCWTLDPLTGIRYIQVPDTAYQGMAHRETMTGKSLGLIHTGNLYSPHLIQNYFDRRDDHDYMFVNAYSLFAYRPEDLLIYNTHIPFTSVAYTTSGSSLQSNDRLRLGFFGNLNSKLGIGTSLDYVYARGEYMSQATKPLKWNSYVYYLDDRYKATLAFNVSKLANQENGGIQDSSYVLTPDKYKDNLTEPRTMPVNLVDTWNDMDSWNLHFNHSYDLGFYKDVTMPEDTTTVEKFVSVSSIFHTIDIERYDHEFIMEANADQTAKKTFFPHSYYDKNATADSSSYLSLSTVAGIRLNEGFNKYSQFGLSAFVGFQHQRYRQLQDTLVADTLHTHITNNLFVGGQLSRHMARRFTFDVTARLYLSGDKIGDFDVTGNLQTVIPAGRDSIVFSGSGYLRSQSPSHLLQRFYSNHHYWDNDFDPERRVRLEGNLMYSLTGTRVRVGVENVSNYHYFNSRDYLPRQYEDQLQVVSAEFDQRLHWRAIHFDNRVLVQTSSDDAILPLPNFVWQSDLNLQFCIAHSLTTQLGITGVYVSKYYAPTYQPATQQFAVQNHFKVGNCPVFNAYVNCNLKKIKFYILYSGLTSNTFSSNKFVMPFYPLQSTRIEYGVIFDLQN